MLWGERGGGRRKVKEVKKLLYCFLPQNLSGEKEKGRKCTDWSFPLFSRVVSTTRGKKMAISPAQNLFFTVFFKKSPKTCVGWFLNLGTFSMSPSNLAHTFKAKRGLFPETVTISEVKILGRHNINWPLSCRHLTKVQSVPPKRAFSRPSLFSLSILCIP